MFQVDAMTVLSQFQPWGFESYDADYRENQGRVLVTKLPHPRAVLCVVRPTRCDIDVWTKDGLIPVDGSPIRTYFLVDRRLHEKEFYAESDTYLIWYLDHTITGQGTPPRGIMLKVGCATHWYDEDVRISMAAAFGLELAPTTVYHSFGDFWRRMYQHIGNDHYHIEFQTGRCVLINGSSRAPSLRRPSTGNTTTRLATFALRA